MSASLLKKSLKLFEEETNTDKSVKKRNKVISQKQASLKDKKIKSALEAYIKKNPKEDKTLENLAVLQKISLKDTVTKESSDKVTRKLFKCTFIFFLITHFPPP